MTQLERDELVEHYLSGAMSTGEVEKFQTRIASDPELRRSLKAQEIIRAAILHEVEQDVPERATYHAALMGLLAATPATVGTAVGGAAGTSSAAAAGTAGISAAKVLAGALIAGTLTLGTVMVINVKKESGVAPAMAPRTPQVQQAPAITPAQPPTPGAQFPAATSPAAVAPRESLNTARTQQNGRIRSQETQQKQSGDQKDRKNNRSYDLDPMDNTHDGSARIVP